MLEETLRWESPIQIVSRAAVEERRDRGYPDPARARARARRSDPRTATRRASAIRTASTSAGSGEPHLAFGLGRHYCAGSRLAILEATVAINALLDRFADLRLDPRVRPPRVTGRRVPRSRSSESSPILCAMSPKLRSAFESELGAAEALRRAGDLDAAFRHLERAHILGQQYVATARAHPPRDAADRTRAPRRCARSPGSSCAFRPPRSARRSASRRAATRAARTSASSRRWRSRPT